MGSKIELSLWLLLSCQTILKFYSICSITVFVSLFLIKHCLIVTEYPLLWIVLCKSFHPLSPPIGQFCRLLSYWRAVADNHLMRCHNILCSHLIYTSKTNGWTRDNLVSSIEFSFSKIWNSLVWLRILFKIKNRCKSSLVSPSWISGDSAPSCGHIEFPHLDEILHQSNI